MRERAEAATPGPWQWRSSLSIGALDLTKPVTLPGGIAGHPLNVLKTTDDWPPNQPDAEHIAAWHPAVALAVADWLDDMSSDTYLGSITRGRAVAVARTYLGEAP